MASAPQPGAPVRHLGRLVLVAALMSGCSTLVYELAWIRVLILSVGATYPAITVVLAGMMLGLGVGSILGGRLADRTGRPLLAYAAVEVGVLAAAGCFPVVNAVVGRVDPAAIGLLPGRAVLAGLLMLPATTLMGLTFPLLSTALHRDDAGAAHVPALYGTNTLGAALGAVLGGLVLPFAVGVPTTLVLAGGLNASAAIVAWMASRYPLPRTLARPAPGTDPTGFEDRHGLLLLLAFGSGALVMLAELFWTRSLMQIPGEAFQGLAIEPADMITLVMVLVLLGNGLGGLVASRFARWGPGQVARALSVTWVAGGLVALLALEWFGVRIGGVRDGTGWSWYHLAFRMLPVAIPSVLLGVSFPLLARLYSGALAGHGRRMGQVWLVNTVGSVGASVLGGWTLMPILGTGGGLVLTAALACALGWAAGRLAGRGVRGWPSLVAGLVIALVALAVPLGPGQFYRYEIHGEVLDSWEGWESTTVVVRREDGSELISSNGRWIPGDAKYLGGGRGIVARLEAMLGHPLDDVLLVGFGTGLYAKGMMEGDHIEHLTIVEIDGAQFRATEHFHTGDVLTDPRVTIEVDDALHYLATTDRTFDAILVDAWGPEASPALYSLEFHQRALARLRPTGLVWAKTRSAHLLDAVSTKVVRDAARCAYGRSAVVQNPDSASTGLVGFGAGARLSDDVESLAPCDDEADPLRILHPRRLRLEAAPRVQKGTPPSGPGGAQGGKGADDGRKGAGSQRFLPPADPW